MLARRNKKAPSFGRRLYHFEYARNESQPDGNRYARRRVVHVWGVIRAVIVRPINARCDYNRSWIGVIGAIRPIGWVVRYTGAIVARRIRVGTTAVITPRLGWRCER